LKSIKNIEKITNTMMIVASTKMGKAQKAMAVARVYGETDRHLYNKAETAAPEEAKKKLLVVLSSDKGLCGSIHSSLSRTARKFLGENPDVDVVIVGDKVRNQLMRTHAKNIVLSFSQIGKEAPTYNEAAVIADQIQQLGNDYDDIQILYNKFVSSMSFSPEIKHAYTKESIETSPKFSTFELEDEVVGDLAEFSFANSLLQSLAEGHAAEIAARRNAMDSASKNANDMIGKFTILYNRTRQAVITNELVDIITGASSLE
jgi:F-type H+-transporting ATPase subunit gamma